LKEKPTYDALLAEIMPMPVVDCHDHASGRAKSDDILAFVAAGYFGSDLHSAADDQAMRIMTDTALPLAERWPVFRDAFRAARFTGYGRAVTRSLEKVFGAQPLSLDALNDMQARLPDYSQPAAYDAFYEEARIAARIADSWPSLDSLIAGTYQGLPNQRLAISLPSLHRITCRADFTGLEQAMGTTVTSLDDYLQLCHDSFRHWRKAGAVCFKDQSAYTRSIAYGNPARSEAEAVFNKVIADPRYSAEYDPASNPLSDYLMHEFLRMARELGLPVQIHTGHMAGIRNDVAKANAQGLRSVVEIHRDVQFDLFHANWPYDDDIVFLVKNYPNVAVDFCWTHIVDPLYSKRLMKQLVSAVPYTKVHGFGSDVFGSQPHIVWAHCLIAKENIASALAEMVDDGYIQDHDALEIAEAWLFGNPNRFFALELSAERA
jgi:uncharacterized protein